MVLPLPFEVPTALDYFATLVLEDTGFSVLEAAVSVAQDEDPGLDVQGVLARIDALAERLRRRIPADAAAVQRLRFLNRYYFEELGFAGNINHYDDPANSSLPVVLESRRGIPLTLALIYIELATQIGLRAQGVSFPGHFLVKLTLPRGEVVVDPFNGRSLGREELEERLQPYRHRIGPAGADEEVPLGLFLQPASGREIIARLLRNLVVIHRGSGDAERLAAVLHRLVILLPEDWEARRDLALALIRLGRRQQAIQALSVYLAQCPQAEDAAGLRRDLSAWRRGR
jgi:regulator of sirC expression with transglutaminase-like and TPR domain